MSSSALLYLIQNLKNAIFHAMTFSEGTPREHANKPWPLKQYEFDGKKFTLQDPDIRILERLQQGDPVLRPILLDVLKSAYADSNRNMPVAHSIDVRFTISLRTLRTIAQSLDWSIDEELVTPPDSEKQQKTYQLRKLKPFEEFKPAHRTRHEEVAERRQMVLRSKDAPSPLESKQSPKREKFSSFTVRDRAILNVIDSLPLHTPNSLREILEVVNARIPENYPRIKLSELTNILPTLSSETKIPIIIRGNIITRR